MSTLANLAILLNLSTAGLTKGTKDAKGELSSFEKSISSAFSGGVTKIAGFVTAAVGATAIFARFTSAADSMDRMAKSVDKLGISVASFQALSFAANLAGADAETLERSLVTMTRQLAKAAREGGETADVLKRIGLDAKTLAALSVDQQYAQIADAITGISDAGQRAEIVMAIFGKGGLQLMNTIMGGSAAIKAAATDLKEFNAELTRGDLAKVEGMNDAWTRMTTLLDGVTQKVLADLAPGIQTLIEYTIDGLKEINNGLGQAGSSFKGFGDIVNTTMALMVNSFTGAWGQLEMIGGLLYGIGAGITWAFGKGIEAVGAFAEYTLTALEPLDDFFKQIGIDLGEAATGIKEFGAGMAASAEEDFRKAGELFNEGIKDLGDGLTFRAADRFLKDIEKTRRAAEKAVESVGAAKDAEIGGDTPAKKSGAQSVSPAAIERGTVAAYQAILSAGRADALTQVVANGKLQITALDRISRILERQGNAPLVPAAI